MKGEVLDIKEILNNLPENITIKESKNRISNYQRETF